MDDIIVLNKQKFRCFRNFFFQTFFSFELIFILFLFAGRYKGDPRFQWIPVDLTGLFFAISIGIGFIVLLRRRFIIDRKALHLVLLGVVFVLLVLMSLLWTPGVVYAQKKASYIATLTLWPLVACALIIASEEERMKRFLLFLVLFSGWFALEGTMAYLKLGGRGVVTVLGSNYLDLGRTLGIGALILLAYALFYTKNWFKGAAAIGLFCYYLFLLLVSGGRGPFLATVLALFVPIFLSIRLSRIEAIKARKYLFILLLILLLAAVAISYLYISGSLTTTLARLAVLLQPGYGSSAGARVNHIKNSLALWQQAPLLGHGIGAYPIVLGRRDIRAYPHNILLEIAAELGFIGIIIFVALVLYALKSLGTLRHLRQNPWKMVLVLLFANVFLNAMVTGDISDNRFLFGVLGLMVFRQPVPSSNLPL